MITSLALIPQCLGRALRREGGQDLIEYALLILLVALVVVGVLSFLGPTIRDVYYNRVIGVFPS